MSSPEEIAVLRDAAAVRDMFDAVANRYDLANHLLSLGCDFFWRRRAAEKIAHWKPPCVLDLATGTGDLALTLQRKLPSSQVVGVDFASKMVVSAWQKGLRQVLLADATSLPLADGSFDVATIGFGLRNIQNRAGALREMRRVLTSKGHLLVLEFSLPANATLRSMYRFYLHNILPTVSSFITSQREAYKYLGLSIESFPSGCAMCELINANGFAGAAAEPLTGGIVTIYTAKAAV